MKCHTNVNHTPPIQLPHTYFEHILLLILSCIYKKIKKGKIPYSFLPSLVIQYKIKNKIYN
jgi:hypothetical protein